MQRADQDPDEGAAAPPRPDDGRSDTTPPVGQPLVRSRLRPEVTPAEVVEGPAEPPVEPGPLAGRVGLVTGAASPLGEAFGVALSSRGARVCLVDDDLADLRAAAQRCGGTDGSLVLRADPASVEELTDAVAFLDRSGVRPDLVVHAALAGPASPPPHGAPSADTEPLSELDQRHHVEVRGPMALSERVLPLLAPDATVVFVDLRAGDGPAPGPERIVAAARRELVDGARVALEEHDVRVLSVSVVADDSADATSLAGDLATDVAGVSLDLIGRAGAAEVTHVHVDLVNRSTVLLDADADG